MLINKINLINLKKIFKDNGLKNTPTRMSIVEVFTKNDKPISANFIYKALKEKLDEATVYRTLSSFEKSKILRRVNLRKESVFYELNNDHHHHIICTKCGLIEDFKENKDIEKLLNQIIEKSAKFKNIKEHSLELFGFCTVCN
jgi:Fe2+ or Zn2+ uptake regulation protein